MTTAFDLRPDGWAEPAYVGDGDDVWLFLERADKNRICVVRCHVLVAQGNHARVYELPFGSPGWRRLDELRVPPHDSRHPARQRRTFFETEYDVENE